MYLTKVTNMCRTLSKSSFLSMLESEIYPFIKCGFKISDFQIFINSDRKKFEFFYTFYCDLLAHFILIQKHIKDKHLPRYEGGFILQKKKNTKILKNCFLKNSFFKFHF